MADGRRLRLDRTEVDRFAAASGDVNPLHVDPAFARRSAFGEPVVHGALASLALLGCLPAADLAPINAVRASFTGPVLPGQEVRAEVAADARRPGRWRLALTGRGKVLLRLEAWAGDEPPAGAAPDHPAPMRTTPADLDLAGVAPGYTAGGAYAPARDLRTLADDLGAGALAPGLLAGIAWCSYVVGMELPGLHSLLAGLRLAVGPGDWAGELHHGLTVTHVDTRTGWLQVDGRLAAPGAQATAAIEAFGRPRPGVREPLAATAATGTGSVAIAGASRGFGAALTLAFLAGGRRVQGLYAVSDAAAAELRAAAGAGADRLELHRVDAGDAAAVEGMSDGLGPLEGIVLNAAPPPLGMRVTSASAVDLAAYVAASLERVATPLGAWLPQLEPDGWVLFCSSAALLDPPLEWPHYVAAKGAVEGLAAWVAASRPDARVVVLRAPKMHTDFTAGPSGGLGAADPDAVAIRVAGRLADGTLPAGVTVLGPEEVA